MLAITRERGFYCVTDTVSGEDLRAPALSIEVNNAEGWIEVRSAAEAVGILRGDKVRMFGDRHHPVAVLIGQCTGDVVACLWDSGDMLARMVGERITLDVGDGYLSLGVGDAWCKVREVDV